MPTPRPHTGSEWMQIVSMTYLRNDVCWRVAISQTCFFVRYCWTSNTGRVLLCSTILELDLWYALRSRLAVHRARRSAGGVRAFLLGSALHPFRHFGIHHQLVQHLSPAASERDSLRRCCMQTVCPALVSFSNNKDK